MGDFYSVKTAGKNSSESSKEVRIEKENVKANLFNAVKNANKLSDIS